METYPHLAPDLLVLHLMPRWHLLDSILFHRLAVAVLLDRS